MAKPRPPPDRAMLVIVAMSAVVMAAPTVVMALIDSHARTVAKNDQCGTVAPATSSHRPWRVAPERCDDLTLW